MDLSNISHILFAGRLVQESALVVSGSEGEGDADRIVAKDGRGHLTIPGRGLAGAMVAMARRFYIDLPDEISRGLSETAKTHPKSSCWKFHNSHPIEDNAQGEEYWTFLAPEINPVEYRQGVGIRQDTGARAGGVLYDTECVPCGTKWSFLLDVDIAKLEVRQRDIVVGTAARVLRQWGEGRCWLGGDVARGLGWLKLTDLWAACLPKGTEDLWPNAKLPCKQALMAVFRKDAQRQPDIEILSGAGITDFEKSAPSTRSWYFAELEGSIEVGPPEEGDKSSWGMDVLSVGGHSSQDVFLKYDRDHWLKPRGINEDIFKAELSADRSIAMARYSDGSDATLMPFIPGAGLRGPLRHALSRQLRQKDEEVSDPNVRLDGRDSGCPGVIFGTIDRSARLLIRDAYLDPTSQWAVARIEHHAEDEFAAGPFESSKFNSVALLQGTFRWRMVIEGKRLEDVKGWAAKLQPLICGESSLGARHHIPIGGGKWRGSGWVKWNAPEKWKFTELSAEAQLDQGRAFESKAAQAELNALPVEPKRGARQKGTTEELKAILEEGILLNLSAKDADAPLTLAEVSRSAPRGAIAWWMEPSIDLHDDIHPPRGLSFGHGSPPEGDNTALEEARVCYTNGFWRAVRTGPYKYRIVSATEDAGGTEKAQRRSFPVFLRRDMARFGFSGLSRERVIMHEYLVDDRIVGFRWEYES